MNSIFCRAIVAIICVVQLAGAPSAPGSLEPENLVELRKCIALSSRLYEEGRFSEAEGVLRRAIHYAEQFSAVDRLRQSTLQRQSGAGPVVSVGSHEPSAVAPSALADSTRGIRGGNTPQESRGQRQLTAPQEKFSKRRDRHVDDRRWYDADGLIYCRMHQHRQAHPLVSRSRIPRGDMASDPRSNLRHWYVFIDS